MHQTLHLSLAFEVRVELPVFFCFQVLPGVIHKPKKRYPLSYGCPHFLGEEFEGRTRDWYFMCQAGTRVASLTADGNFVSCLNVPRNETTIQGTVFEDKFSDIWFSRYEFFRTKLSSKCENCRICPDEKWCGGDSFHSWNFDENKPYICYRER